MGKITELNKYREMLTSSQEVGLNLELHNFLETAPHQWDGVETLCNFVHLLGTEKYPLPEILLTIGRDPHLFFWSHLLIGSLSLDKLDKLLQALQEVFPNDRAVIDEIQAFYVLHQQEKLECLID